MLALAGAVLCLLVAVGSLLAPAPAPVPLRADGTAVVPGPSLFSPGAALHVAAGSGPGAGRALADGCRGESSDGRDLGASSSSVSREVELGDGTPVEAVARSSRVRGGDAVRCAGVGTAVWVGADTADRVVVGVLTALMLPVCAGAAAVFLLVGRAARRGR